MQNDLKNMQRIKRIGWRSKESLPIPIRVIRNKYGICAKPKFV